MSTVTVLLSTYNGASCLPDQLDSLLAQSRPVDRILVRDDGSSDDTLGILAHYAERHAGLSFYQGPNVGAMRSFFDLLERAAGGEEPATDYYALCDQDDRWLPDRVERGIARIEQAAAVDGAAMPMLSCARPQLVDARFEPIRETRRFVLPRPSFGNALVENICIGCTATFNRALLVSAVTAGIPDAAVMHDWWLYLTAAGLGRVLYDPIPGVMYRQHGGNAVGMAATNASHQLGRARRYLKAKGKSQLAGQTADFLRLVGTRLSLADAALAVRFLDGQRGLARRISLAADRTLRRQRKGDDLLFRLMLILGHYRPA